jgi:hypothetical protein
MEEPVDETGRSPTQARLFTFTLSPGLEPPPLLAGCGYGRSKWYDLAIDPDNPEAISDFPR